MYLCTHVRIYVYEYIFPLETKKKKLDDDGIEIHINMVRWVNSDVNFAKIRLLHIFTKITCKFGNTIDYIY